MKSIHVKIALSALTTLLLFFVTSVIYERVSVYLYIVAVLLCGLSCGITAKLIKQRRDIKKKQIKTYIVFVYFLFTLAIAGVVYLIESLLNIDYIIKIYSAAGVLFVGGLFVLINILKKERFFK